MKIFKVSSLLLGLTLLISSCRTVSYMGDKLPPTSKLDVYYDTKDVKKNYKVIGHIYASTLIRAEKSREAILTKAKSAGADAVIIPKITTNTNGKTTESYQEADAIKYLD